ncbi:MAG: HAMP domain-containing histidine kinase [Ekhidna sp.]|nr:HAMP domain-containing histidine kinase [Ekhidna sp.]
MNQLAVLCIGIAGILVFINLIFQNYIGIIIDLSAILLIGLPVLLLNRSGRYSLAVYLFLLGFHITLFMGTYHTILEGRQNGVEYLFIPGAISTIILLRGLPQYLGVLINFVVLLSLIFIRFEFYGGGNSSTYSRSMMILFAAYLMVYFFVANFKNKLFKTVENAEQLNAELSKKEEALVDSNKSKDQLFSIIAHDLRAPLASVQGLLEPSIIRSMNKEDYLLYAEKVKDRVDVITSTMNGLLDWAKSQLGNLTVNPEVVDVPKEIRFLVDLFADSLQSKNIELGIDMSSVKAFMDINHFIVIIRNIFHNAIKFSPIESRIEISVKKAGSEVCISIMDHGKGIDLETRNRILDGKLVTSSFGTAGESGSGIGLSFCYELIKKNRGRLSILDGEPNGTTFQVWLPAAK